MNKELLAALLSVQPNKTGNYPNAHWATLFAFYNENKVEDLPKLGMSCQPCYDKVYKFCRERLLNQLSIEMSPPQNLCDNKQEAREKAEELKAQRNA